jgi:hypothetical protein
VIRRLALALLAAVAQESAAPPVARTTLDGRPSAAVVTLARGMRVAYDVRTCGMFRAWSGARSPGDRGAQSWFEAAAGRAWWLARAGHARALEPIWLGYVLDGGRATLRYELRGEEGLAIAVEESPEFVAPTDLGDEPTHVAPWLHGEMLGVRRAFRATGIPEGTRLFLTLDGEIRGRYLVDDVLDPCEAPCEPTSPQRRCERLFARLPFEGGDARNEIVFFFDPRVEASAR